MAGFVQIIEWKSTRLDEVEALMKKFREAPRDVGPSRVTVTADRDRANTYLTIAEFESHEVAMANSQNPDTTAFAQKMAALCDGPPSFHNLDLVSSEVFT